MSPKEEVARILRRLWKRYTRIVTARSNDKKTRKTIASASTVESRPVIKHTRWVNFYPPCEGDSPEHPWRTTSWINRGAADRNAKPGRLACVQVEFKDGDGLSERRTSARWRRSKRRKSRTKMAGSYHHCANEDGTYRGPHLCENLKDSYEAIEEMFFMINWLARQDQTQTAANKIQSASDAYFRCLRGEEPWPNFMGEND